MHSVHWMVQCRVTGFTGACSVAGSLSLDAAVPQAGGSLEEAVPPDLGSLEAAVLRAVCSLEAAYKLELVTLHGAVSWAVGSQEATVR